MKQLKSLLCFVPCLLQTPLKTQEPWIVEDSDYLDLELRKSTLPLPKHVLITGLFVKRDFKKDEILGEYRGPVVYNELSGDPVFDYEDKFLALNDKYVLLGRSVAAYANDCINFDVKKYGSEEYKNWVEKEEFPRHENCEYNSRFLYKGNKVFLVAKKDLRAGEEIFLSYGFEYWRSYYEFYDEEGKIKA